MLEALLILNMDSHFHGNDRPVKLGFPFSWDRHKQNRRGLKRNNVRSFINIKLGFPFSRE
jgi:hypothetical protein